MAFMNRAAQAAQMWHREWPELEAEGMALVGQLSEVVHLGATHHATPMLAQLGIKTGEFDVLATLRRSGRPYALTPTDLYAATMVSSGGMTARIDRLAALGLVVRQPNPQDRRGTLVSLTEKGLGTVNLMMPQHAANKMRLVSGLSPADRKTLAELLAKLICTVDPASPDYIGGPLEPP
ncbi:DNA-binding MarR family transcriptional regulator [Devosia sp. UYZn731]|uniref:MarR family winged helix-turn-helix transcriptional regulator n=1 Tax=Devosia sp. UYZn731 TaxID=3156345 RepID=UPI003397C07B